MNYVDALNIVLTSFGYIVNMYPIYDKLEPSLRSPRNLLLCCFVAMFFSASVYSGFAQLSISCFGINNIKQNLFENFDRATYGNLPIVVKVIFLVIFSCALPFNVLPTRNSAIAFYLELTESKVSQ